MWESEWVKKQLGFAERDEYEISIPFFAPFLRECIEKPCAIRIEHEKATSASVEVYFMCTWIRKVSRKMSGHREKKMLREKWEWCDGFPNGVESHPQFSVWTVAWESK